jgi:hypothetical protein
MPAMAWHGSDHAAAPDPQATPRLPAIGECHDFPRPSSLPGRMLTLNTTPH